MTSLRYTNMTTVLTMGLLPSLEIALMRSLSFSLSSVIFLNKKNKKLSDCWETVRRESMPRIAEMDVEMTA